MTDPRPAVTEELVEKIARAHYEAEPYVDAVDAPIPWEKIIKCHGFLAGKLKAARACLAEIEAEGLVIVPRAPTEEMLEILRKQGGIDGYEACLAAAPKQG